jgi:hypothetical protein
MGLFDRLRGVDSAVAEAPPSLARDAQAMRATLTAMHDERGGSDLELHALVHDLLEGEIEAPTRDVRDLVANGVNPDEFYERELSPNWDGLDEESRADKLDGFLELALMVEDSPDALPREMAANLRTKLLILAWAFDEEHGYLGRMSRGREAD